jgi:UDP-N-acetylglucosamine 2-epimerase
MSDIFFDELGLPRPDRSLGVGSGTHAEQQAKAMIEFEKACVEYRPDLVVVVGDVNSTLACAITAKKLCIPVAHVEAGLRSRDWKMPEEINRLLTDAISDYLFTPSRDADENLLKEGVDAERIHFVGNVMIDCLLTLLPQAERRNTLASFGVEPGRYATLTLHRPSNVDDPEVFRGIVEVLVELSRSMPIVWPIHPRSRKNLERFGLFDKIASCADLRLTGPVGYLDMLALNQRARMIVTDSGGLQEEAGLVVQEKKTEAPRPTGFKALLASFFTPMVLRYAVPALGLVVMTSIAVVVLRDSTTQKNAATQSVALNETAKVAPELRESDRSNSNALANDSGGKKPQAEQPRDVKAPAKTGETESAKESPEAKREPTATSHSPERTRPSRRVSSATGCCPSASTRPQNA